MCNSKIQKKSDTDNFDINLILKSKYHYRQYWNSPSNLKRLDAASDGTCYNMSWKWYHFKRIDYQGSGIHMASGVCWISCSIKWTRNIGYAVCIASLHEQSLDSHTRCTTCK